MFPPVAPRFGPRVSARPALPTATGELVADDSPDIDVQQLVASNEADRLDAERVEHERQSRLSRWQETRERG